MKCIIIAEIGENFIGDINRAKTMIKEAARAGADIVKFQSFKGNDVPDNDPEKDWFYKVELSDENHLELKKTADDNGIEFLSAPFSLDRARLLLGKMKLNKIKIIHALHLFVNADTMKQLTPIV